MLQKVRTGRGFIAALDQSGGSTPKALGLYGIESDAWSSEDEMFDLMHAMRSRIVTSPAFSGERVLGAILFEQTMDRQIEGVGSASTSGRSSTWCRSSRSTRVSRMWQTVPR